MLRHTWTPIRIIVVNLNLSILSIVTQIFVKNNTRIDSDLSSATLSEEELYHDAQVRHEAGSGELSTDIVPPCMANFYFGPSRRRALYSLQLKALGYSLKARLWCELDVDHLSDIPWNDAFSKLLFPPVYKNLMFSFLEGHVANEPVFDDIVEGKGLGIVILLLSSSGIGKTLIAEAVAEEACKPIYLLNAAEFGQQPESIESRLPKIFELAES